MSGILNLKGLTSFSVTRINKEIKVSDTGWLSLFENNKNITTISRREFDTSKVATMRNLFYNIYFMSHLDMGVWNTLRLINTDQIFDRCKELTAKVNKKAKEIPIKGSSLAFLLMT